jgi:hypothetical protein
MAKASARIADIVIGKNAKELQGSFFYGARSMELSAAFSNATAKWVL